MLGKNPTHRTHLRIVRPTDGLETTPRRSDEEDCNPQCAVRVDLSTMQVHIGWANCETPQNAALIFMALSLAKKALLDSASIEDTGGGSA